MTLDQLFPDLYLENTTFECKSILNKDNIVGWLKTIAGFANAHGGDFYIGVEDKTNKLIGFDRITADKERNYFNNQVNEHLIPRPQMSLSFLRYEVNNTERFIIKVHVENSPIKPIVLKYQGIPAIFMRRDGFTNGATYEEIIEMSIQSKNTQYDMLPSDATYNAGDFSDLFSFYKDHNNGRELSEKALQSMGFFNEQEKLLNGALLFSDNYNGTKTQVQCSVFSGTNKSSERIITINRYKGNLIQSIRYILDFVNQRMNRSIIKEDTGRKNIDAYPPRALFEGIINAIAHRDYYLDGTQIQIDMFRDRLEITSPGSIYRSAPIEKTYDLSKVISKRRNELIANVFVACNVMEAAGTGFDKIIQDYANETIEKKPYAYSTSDHFTLVLPDLTYADGIKDGSIPNITYLPGKKASPKDEQILSFCYYQPHTAAEIAAHLGISDSTYFRKTILGNLLAEDLLLYSKVSRAAYYKTNPNQVFLQ